MASIVESIAGDRRIVLANEEFLRPFGFSTDWKKIRIGVRLAFNGSSNIPSPAFQLGVSQGLTDGFKSSNTTDYFGVRFNGVGNWTFNVGPPAYYSGTMFFTTIFRRGNVSVVNANNSQVGYVSADPAAIRSTFYCDITKGNTYSITLYGMTVQANAQTDQSLTQFYRLLEAETVAGGEAIVGQTASMDYSPGAGLFDAVSIYWDQASPSVEISDVAVCRFN